MEEKLTQRYLMPSVQMLSLFVVTSAPVQLLLACVALVSLSTGCSMIFAAPYMHSIQHLYDGLALLELTQTDEWASNAS